MIRFFKPQHTEKGLKYWHLFTKGILLIIAMNIWTIGTVQLKAQALDSLQIRVGTTVTAALKDHQPLWIVANRWGSLQDRQADIRTHISMSNRHIFGKDDSFRAYLRKYNKQPVFSVSYGFSVANNDLFQHTYLQEAYLKAELNHWHLSVGRYPGVVGDVSKSISSGSMGISGNALPIPRISLGVNDYTDFPLLPPGIIQFKGEISHGMMEREAYVRNARYHQRSFYLQAGKSAFKIFTVYGGLNQFVIWGGQHPEKKLPNQWKELARVIVPGNNLGFFDYGLTLLARQYKIKAYTQVPFEGRGNINPLRIKDRLVGIELSDHRPGTYFPVLSLELINTTWLDTRIMDTSAADDYNFYNNLVYADGWTYADRILGTPLFFNRVRASSYFDEAYNLAQDWNIVNNRINGVHIGMKGQFPYEELRYRTLVTHTINHGNYYNKDLFNLINRHQTYLLQEFSYIHRAVSVNAAVGCDLGGLTSNVGVMAGLEYHVNYKESARKMGPAQYMKRRKSLRRRW